MIGLNRLYNFVGADILYMQFDSALDIRLQSLEPGTSFISTKILLQL